MHLFKSDSRNSFNNLRQEAKFKKNYENLFHLRLPHPDTVDNVMRHLPEEVLEQLKKKLLCSLLDMKSLHKYRYLGKWFTVAIDGTGVVSFDHKHCTQCLHSTSKKGKTKYFHNVLEAKLVTHNGFSISLATQWIENPVDEYDKQDCERKAFTRLAEKLKKNYPRLPMCLLVDGLYPYQGFFETCKVNDWMYIATFKDGCLPSVWQEIVELLPLMPDNHRQERRYQGKTTIEQKYSWVNDIDYNGHCLHWIECLETIKDEEGKCHTTQFSQVTNIPPCYRTITGLLATGRMRWKIENEGFNTQKNLGYNMQHKYSRNNYLAMKNYYQSLQIAHLINQLVELSTKCKKLMTGKNTTKHLWKCLLGFMIYGTISSQEISELSKHRVQFQFQ